MNLIFSFSYLFKFELCTFRNDGKIVIRNTVPDTITSWILSAFSVDNINGLGLLDEPLKVSFYLSNMNILLKILL